MTRDAAHRSVAESERELDDSRCVLLVEDDPLVVEVLSEIVGSLGFEVLTAGDGAQAIDLLDRAKDKIACVILDYEIPDMHCSQVLRCLRRLSSDVRVLLSSGYPEFSLDLPSSPDKVDGFIQKPYDPRLLASKLNSIIRS